MPERPTRQYLYKHKIAALKPSPHRRDTAPVTEHDLSDAGHPERNALDEFMLAQRVRFGKAVIKWEQGFVARRRAQLTADSPERWTRRGISGGHSGPARVGQIDEAMDPVEAMDLSDE